MRRTVMLAVAALAAAAVVWFFGGMVMQWLRSLHGVHS